MTTPGSLQARLEAEAEELSRGWPSFRSFEDVRDLIALLREAALAGTVQADALGIQLAELQQEKWRLERENTKLREFTESVVITFRNYYCGAISRADVDDKIAEWLKLRTAPVRAAGEKTP